MKILYYIPSLESVYAGRFIYEGYKNAFTRLGHEFRPYTTADVSSLASILDTYSPDIFIYSFHRYSLKFLDLDLLVKYRKKGMVVFTQVTTWKDQSKQLAGGNLENDTHLVDLLKSGKAGDVYYHWLEQDDPKMDGFTKTIGKNFHTILLAADTKIYFPDYDPNYSCDISYVGSLLPSKKAFIKTHLLPLRSLYSTKIYGSDWTLSNKLSGYVQKLGQYFNVGLLKNVRKFNLSLDNERKVYSSAKISLNIHEEHQRRDGSDFNERTFKILACGGFEICDSVAVLRKYFTEQELVIAQDTADWFDKIAYYLKNDAKREVISKNGFSKIIREHTYANRVAQIINIYNTL